MLASFFSSKSLLNFICIYIFRSIFSLIGNHLHFLQSLLERTQFPNALNQKQRLRVSFYFSRWNVHYLHTQEKISLDYRPHYSIISTKKNNNQLRTHTYQPQLLGDDGRKTQQRKKRKLLFKKNSNTKFFHLNNNYLLIGRTLFESNLRFCVFGILSKPTTLVKPLKKYCS